jgi:DNA modification methylase
VDYGAKTEFLAAYLGQEGSRSNSTIENDNMDAQSFYNFLLAAFQNANDAMRPGAAIYVFHAESTGLQFRQAYSDAGLKLAQCLIWEKNAFVLGRQDYQWRHEPILYGWKEGAGHYFVNDRTQDTVMLEDELDFKSMKKPELLAFIDKMFRDYKDQTTVHYEKKPSRNSLHPTMKPIPLVGRLMNNSSKPGWLVGDFFGGSGTTLMAAEQLGRTAYLMECDPRNVDVIVQRWEAYTGKKAVLFHDQP